MLHPLYEADGDGSALLRVLEIEVDATDDPLAQARVPREGAAGPPRAARRSGARLRLCRARRAPVARPERHRAVARARRAAEPPRPSARPSSSRSCREVVPEIFDGERAARGHAEDRRVWRATSSPIASSRASTTRRRSSCRADDRSALSALESLYEEAGDPQTPARSAQATDAKLPRPTPRRSSSSSGGRGSCRRARGSAAARSRSTKHVLELVARPRRARRAREALHRRERAGPIWSSSTARSSTPTSAIPPELHVEIARIARNS